MNKRKRSSSIYNKRKKTRRSRRNVQRGEAVRTAVLPNGVRGGVPANSAIHQRTFRGRRKPQSKGLKRARRGNTGTKPSTINTSQMMTYKVKPNEKGVLGLLSRKIVVKDPFSNINEQADEQGGGYQLPDYNTSTPNIIPDVYSTYDAMLGDTTTTTVAASHRTDWTMFTNDSWRDNLCYLLGLFSPILGVGTDTQPTLANIQTPATFPTGIQAAIPTYMQTGANGTAMWGYAPPGSLRVQSSTSPNPVTYCPYGLPVPSLNSNKYTALNDNLNQVGWSVQQHYVLSESITWYVHNQGPTDMTVILNECTLKYDIPIINQAVTMDDGNANINIPYGGMLDPLELWRNSRTRQAFADKNNMELPGTRSTADVNDYWQSFNTGTDNRERLNNDITDVQSSTKYADRLNACYNVKKHFQVIRPGQTAHFKIKVDFNHKVSPHQITNMYAIGGKSKTFFFEYLTRPVAAGNITNGGTPNTASVVTGRGMGRPPAEISIRWTKSKKFLLDQRMPTNTLTIRAPRPKYNYFGIIESDGDRKAIITDNNDDPYGAEDVNPDAIDELNQALGGVFDINIGDVTIF